MTPFERDLLEFLKHAVPGPDWEQVGLPLWPGADPGRADQADAEDPADEGPKDPMASAA